VRFGTLVETDEDIRRAELADKEDPPLATPVAKAAQSASPVVTAKPRRAASFKPTRRPPICVLTVFDDGKTEGEVIRIRGDRFTIGRAEGDFLIPHDDQISSKHIEITRQLVSGEHRWVVTDLQSTNGLFLRVSRTILKDRAEFLVGNGRYRFEQGGQQLADTVDHIASGPIPAGTVGSDQVAPAGSSAALVELVAGGIGTRQILTKNEYWIGSDPGCAFCRSADSFVEPRHVRVFRAPDGIWHAQNNKTANGVWLKVPQVSVEESVLCQIGEQRLRLKVGE